jgi:hypothetical protein
MTKQGIPAALTLAGIDPDAAVSVVRLAVAPAALHIGDNAELETALRPARNRQVTAALSYVIEFARSTGRPSCKFVHAGHDLAGARGAPRTAPSVRLPSDVDPVVRPDAHAVELIVNGKRVACANFRCAPDRSPSSLKPGRRPASGPLELAQ